MLDDRPEFGLRGVALAHLREVEVLEGRPAGELRASPQPLQRGVESHLIVFPLIIRIDVEKSGDNGDNNQHENIDNAINCKQTDL